MKLAAYCGFFRRENIIILDALSDMLRVVICRDAS